MRATILAMKHPLAQRYAFCRLVLGEPRWDAMLIAAALQANGLMDGDEYDVIERGWNPQ